ncbi:hypothetical protein GGI13_005808 [Coemansia sp. RSA 455]|nr:hypothetical protein GGI13_005808 [Coemansia sp. RSA 455]
MQISSQKNSRIYEDFDSPEEALERLIWMYEDRLKALCPTMLNVNYSLDDLKRFIDQHNECCVLILDLRLNAYISHDAAWIKSSIHAHLQRLLLKSKGPNIAISQ